MRDDVLTVADFLDHDEVLALNSITFDTHPQRPDARLLDVVAEDNDLRTLAHSVRARATHALSEFYELAPLYCDYVSIHAIGPEREVDSHPLHADNENLDGTPNHTPWREVSALLYLSTQGSDFDGGSIVFPWVPLELGPQAGMLVGFRADRHHAHEVHPVTRGVRKCLAMWFTTDQSRDEYGWQ